MNLAITTALNEHAIAKLLKAYSKSNAIRDIRTYTNLLDLIADTIETIIPLCHTVVIKKCSMDEIYLTLKHYGDESEFCICLSFVHTDDDLVKKIKKIIDDH